MRYTEGETQPRATISAASVAKFRPWSGLLAAVGTLHQWDGSAWSHCSSYTAASAADPVSFAQLGGVLYLADGQSHLFSWNGTALIDLGAGPSSPPVGRLLLSAQNRLWLAGVAAAPDALYASALLNGALWDATTQMIRIGAEDGEPITGLIDWDDYQLVVFKRSSLYIVRADPSLTGGGTGAPLAQATVTKISAAVGCVSARSVARVGNDVWFLAEGGVFSVGRVLAQTQREVKPPVSQPVQDVLDRVNWSAAGAAAAVFWNNRYLLSLPLDDDLHPTTVLVYHLPRACWCGLWTGWSPQSWASAKVDGQERLTFGRADGQVWRWLDDVPVANEVGETYQDAGADIPSALTTRALSFGAAAAPKSALSVQVEFYGSQALATLAVCLDEDAPRTLALEIPTGSGELTLPFPAPAQLPSAGTRRRAFSAQHLEEFRTLQIHLTSPAGKLSLRSAGASAFVNVAQVEE